MRSWLAHRLACWRHTDAIPGLPGTHLGLMPIAQFLVLAFFVLLWLLPRR